jgi:hypothetical protein
MPTELIPEMLEAERFLKFNENSWAASVISSYLLRNGGSVSVLCPCVHAVG